MYFIICKFVSKIKKLLPLQKKISVNMKNIFSLLILLLTFNTFYAQVIPANRRVDWELVQQNINMQNPEIQVNVLDFGAVGDGVVNDQPAVMDAILSLNGELGYVFFPPGNYLIEEPIVLPDSCILKGAGSNQSVLIFDMQNIAVNCIVISKAQTTSFEPIISGYTKDSDLITVENASVFKVGDYVEIRQENGDWDVVPVSWADYSVGQISKIKQVTGNSLILASALRISYTEELNPQIRPIIPIINSGVQCLKLKRVDEPEEGAGSNIYFNMAANCFVRGVESDTSVGSHISINKSVNILIDGNYIHHAFTYDGTGTRGYGVTLSQHSSECLITNNVFKHLRHAMMAKTGANGNVFSYNYSIEPYRSEQIHDASGDISLHGHFAYSNLFEGNIVQNIIIDHYWGPSGPYNTFFRNRAELYGIIMTVSELQQTNDQNFVGSEVTNTAFLHGLFTLTGSNNFEFGNNVKGNIIPAGTNELSDSSYYLSQQPNFWDSNISWPSVGIPNTLNSGTIPAKIRYEQGEDLTICPDSVITSINTNSQKIVNNYVVMPNPASSFIKIKLPTAYTGKIYLQLTSVFGKKVLVKNKQVSNLQILTVDINNIPTGNYILSVKTNGDFVNKKVVVER